MRKAARAIIIKDDTLLVIHRNKFGKEYYTLPGGGIDAGETPEQAVVRELDEETGVKATIERLVFVEEPGEPYGTQYIFLCRYLTGEPQLREDSEEAALNKQGKNLYTPLWLPLADIASVAFMSPALQKAIQKAVINSFPNTPESL